MVRRDANFLSGERGTIRLHHSSMCVTVYNAPPSVLPPTTVAPNKFDAGRQIVRRWKPFGCELLLERQSISLFALCPTILMVGSVCLTKVSDFCTCYTMQRILWCPKRGRKGSQCLRSSCGSFKEGRSNRMAGGDCTSWICDGSI